MKKLIFMLTAVIFIFTACQKEEGALDPTATSESGFHKANLYKGDCTPSFTTPMIADGGSQDFECDGIVVGTIDVVKTDIDNEPVDGVFDSTRYEVTYNITPGSGWWIDGIHLYIGPEGDIPATGGKKKNPKVGHFEFNYPYYPGVETTPVFTKTVAYNRDNVIAAHADVRLGDDYPLPYTVEDFCEDLPDEVTINVGINFNTSYLNIEVIDDDWLDGTWPGWCIDVDEPINPGNSPFENTAVYCLDEADHIVDNEGNLHMVAWLINQQYIGETSGCLVGDPAEYGIYTYADVQYAIWLLVDYNVPLPDDVAHLGAAFVAALDICRALEIVNDAGDYAAVNDPFEPGCGESTVVVLDPGEGIQKLILEFPLECDQEETAWGFGYQGTPCGNLPANLANGISFTNSNYYGGKAWGWYFFGCQPQQ